MNGFPPPPPPPSSSSSSEHQELTNLKISNWVQIGYRLGFCGVGFCMVPESTTESPRNHFDCNSAYLHAYLLTYLHTS
jgi:hypothetical protein